VVRLNARSPRWSIAQPICDSSTYIPSNISSHYRPSHGRMLQGLDIYIEVLRAASSSKDAQKKAPQRARSQTSANFQTGAIANFS
jgi:hypothetical protein